MRADIVICGAGIAGIAAAYQLNKQHQFANIILVDERPPLTLTSDKSTECYRNFWPGPGDAMVALTNRSIDLLEALARETDNAFHMNRRGYLYASAGNGESLISAASAASSLGAGSIRIHDGTANDPVYIPHQPHGFEALPNGLDIIRDDALIHRHFPWLSADAATVVHARRCGWLSAQQLGMTLLDRARQNGTTLIRGRVSHIDMTGGRVRAVTVERPGATETIETPLFVNAAGPYAPDINAMLGIDLPIALEGHVKISFGDTRAAIPRDAPLIIWCDPQHLSWTDDERNALVASPDMRHLLDSFPAGVHGRPEGRGDSVILYWTYDILSRKPVFPIPHNPAYPEVTIRGMAAAVPALSCYFDQLPKPYIDGGYYTKTPENRPLVGPLPVEGAFISSAYSGYGIMTAMAGAELLAAHATGAGLPPYAQAFAPDRYADPAYQTLLTNWPDSGEL